MTNSFSTLRHRIERLEKESRKAIEQIWPPAITKDCVTLECWKRTPTLSGQLHPSSCPKRQGGDVRVLTDFRRLNAVLQRKPYPLPKISDTTRNGRKIAGPQLNESLRPSTAAEQLGVVLESSCQWQIPQKVVFKIWPNMW